MAFKKFASESLLRQLMLPPSPLAMDTWLDTDVMYPATWSEPKARKYHVCSKCNGTISPKTHYSLFEAFNRQKWITGFYGWYCLKFCLSCAYSDNRINPDSDIERREPNWENPNA